MRFTNYDRSYQVIQHLGGAGKTEEFLCLEQTKDPKQTCLLIRINDQVLAKNLTLFLEEKVRGTNFTDYIECFQEDEFFLIAMNYSLEQSLTEMLQKEYCGRREQMEIARGIFERLLLLDPHPWFVFHALDPDQVTVSRSLEVHWNYHLKQMEMFENYTMTDVAGQLQKLLMTLFEEEEQKQICPQLSAYLQKLGSEKWNSYMQMFQEFMKVYEELSKEDLMDQLPKTFWFRLWEKSKKFLKICQKVLAAVIVIASVVYVIGKLKDDSGKQAAVQSMSRIGDLEIELPEEVTLENGE